MIPKRYQHTYTDTTHKIMNELVEGGHNIRDVINSGIVLFKMASHEQRGVAHMEAYRNPKKDFSAALDEFKKVALSTNIDKLSADNDKELVTFILNKYGPDAEHHARQAISDHDDATAASHIEPQGKEVHTDAKAG